MGQPEPSPVASPSRRRWFQFSLRTLLIVTTVCAALFGILARWSYKARQQRDAVAALGEPWGYVTYDFHISGELAGVPSYWPEWLINALGVDYFANVLVLKPTPGPYAVDLEGRGVHEIDDVRLEYLKGLPKLRYLWLDRTKVTDAGLQHLQGLTELEYLSLSGTQVTEAGVERLQKALPNCRIHH